MLTIRYRPRNHLGFFNPLPYFTGKYEMHSARHVLRRFLNRQRFHNHMHLCELLDLPEAAEWAGYYRFCFDRNPWDKVVSRYFWKYRDRRSRPDFEAFVATDRLVSDFDMYSLNGKCAVDRVFRYEEIPAAMEELGKRFFCKIVLDSRLNSHSRAIRDYRAMYTAASHDCVARKFSREIDLLGYKFE